MWLFFGSKITIVNIKDVYGFFYEKIKFTKISNKFATLIKIKKIDNFNKTMIFLIHS